MLDRIEVSETIHMESRIHLAGELSREQDCYLIRNESVDLNVQLLLPQKADFSEDRHTNLKPGHADPETREVDFLKLNCNLDAGTTTMAVAFGINSIPDLTLESEDSGYRIMHKGEQFGI